MGIKHEILADGIEIYCGDCREILPTLGKVDAVVTDPPYGVQFGYSTYQDEGGIKYMDLISILKGMPLALLQYPEQMMRLVCPVLGAPSEVLAWVYNSNLPRQTRLWGFWDCDVDPKRSKQPAKNPECSKVKNLQVAGYDWREINQVKGNSLEKTDHPCQLPISVARWVLDCLNADTICDPFMGSGTIGLAAIERGREFTGIELDPKYFDVAAKRISKAISQPKSMFAEKSA